MRFFLVIFSVVILGAMLGVGGVIFWQKTQTANPIFIPDPTPTPEPERPLLKYTFENLRTTHIEPSRIALETDPILVTDTYSTYPFQATVSGRKMSGVANIPKDTTATTSAIVMLRGWVPPNQYSPGVGTKNAAAQFVENGFVTLAPDFFGYGTSDPEPTDEWQARFEKPMVALELLAGLEKNGFLLADGSNFQPAQVGFWGHSNGGAIALSALAISKQSIPTALWAPVSAPFPYSILYFSDEEEDEGQQSRKWISLFDKLYDARQFSFTNYLDGLRGPLQIQQGTNDDAVLKWWSDEFVAKLEKENERREEELENEESLENDATLLPIKYEYFLYSGADHNLQPNWDEAVTKDIEFFKKALAPEPLVVQSTE